MIAPVDVANRALSKVGASSITSLTDDSRSARAVNSAFAIVRRSELAANNWGFAIERHSLAEDLTPPAFVKARRFLLPAGHLRVITPDPEAEYNTRDWIIEGEYILTNEGSPLQIRCIMDIEDTSKWHPCFVEAFATKLALELCELITQSNTKKTSLEAQYIQAIRMARRTNAIENAPNNLSVDSSWITVRN